MTRSILTTTLKLAVSAAAVAYLLTSGKLRLSQLAIETGGSKWILAAATSCVVLMLVSHVRYWFLLKHGGIEVTAGKVIRIGFISWFFNATLLGGFGFLSGDAIKVGYLMRHSERRAAILGATLVDRTLGFLGLITLALFALQTGWRETAQSPDLQRLAVGLYAVLIAVGLAVLLAVIATARGRPTALVAGLAVGGAVGWMLAGIYQSPLVPLIVAAAPLTALVAPALLPGATLHEVIVQRLWMGKKIGAFLSALFEYRRRPTALLAGYAASVLIHALALSVLFFAAKGITLPIEPSLRQIWFAAPPANALSVLPLPAGGLGVGETAFDSMLRLCTAPDGTQITGGAALFLTFRLLMTLMGLTGLPLYLTSSGPRRPVDAPP